MDLTVNVSADSRAPTASRMEFLPCRETGFGRLKILALYLQFFIYKIG